MNVVIGLIFIGMIALVFVGWVLKLGRFGVMMIGMTVCVPAAMGCALNLHGSQRYWAVAPVVVFFVLVVLIFREWNKVVKK
jgi:ABC-type molybdate transport system permease subunit